MNSKYGWQSILEELGQFSIEECCGQREQGNVVGAGSSHDHQSGVPRPINGILETKLGQ